MLVRKFKKLRKGSERGGIAKAAKELGINKYTLRNRYRRSRGLISGGG